MAINKQFMQESLDRFQLTKEHLRTCKVCKPINAFECDEGKHLFANWMNYDPLTGEERGKMMTKFFDDECKALRLRLREIGQDVQNLGTRIDSAQVLEQREATPDKGEMMSNLMLAYRHIEDAIMRLGKAIQAFDGGASVYKD